MKSQLVVAVAIVGGILTKCRSVSSADTGLFSSGSESEEDAKGLQYCELLYLFLRQDLPESM